MLTDKNLIKEVPHPSGIGGVQRIYRFPNGFGLSLINSPLAHTFSFAWEAAVLRDVSEDGATFTLTYDTPMTRDVEVFANEQFHDVGVCIGTGRTFIRQTGSTRIVGTRSYPPHQLLRSRPVGSTVL